MKTIIEMAREAGLHLYINDLTEEPYARIVERFAAIVRADEQKKWEEQTDIDIREAVADERNAIYDQWHFCVMADLENGVKWLNEKAAAEWHKNYPAQSNLFPSWVEARGQA
jgi:hypothetical protein